MSAIPTRHRPSFWGTYLKLLPWIGVPALVLCGAGVIHYQSAQSPPKIDPVLFRMWGTGFCIAAFAAITFSGSLVLATIVVTWRKIAKESEKPL
jgi:hypothetical protein